MDPEFRQRLLERFDANGDGQLDEAEKAAAKAAFEARRTEFADQHPQLAERLDRDGDGLEPAEALRARRLHQYLLIRFDANGDGQLDEAEKAAAKAAFEARRAEMIERFDANGDGVLDEAERETARAAFEEQMKDEGGLCHGKIFDRIDTNGDGSIDRGEWQAAAEKLMQMRRNGGGPCGGPRGPRDGRGPGDRPAQRPGHGIGEGNPHGVE
jgi:Ca2+-binding EF-hand superfamily protein